jgi:hypothetical protein
MLLVFLIGGILASFFLNNDIFLEELKRKHFISEGD